MVTKTNSEGQQRMTKEHPLLFDFTYKGKELYVSARQIINTLRYASEQLSYSNYDCDKLERAEKIIRQWCKQNNIAVGPTEAALKKQKEKRHEKLMQDLQSTDPTVFSRAITRMKRSS